MSGGSADPGAGSTLVMRLAGPLQAWGETSRFNRRESAGVPTKSGIVGLLASALGRRRHEEIEDLVGLWLGVRTDQAGSLQRDFHTVSDYRGRSLLSSRVDRRGAQVPANKNTHVTTRYYLQDAVFVAAVAGPCPLLEGLAHALRSPAFPPFLGRRSCPVTQPLLLPSPVGGPLWEGPLPAVLEQVPWQAGKAARRQAEREGRAVLSLPTVVDDEDGDDVRCDVPRSFAPHERALGTRRVRHGWVQIPAGVPCEAGGTAMQEAGPAPHARRHDPFSLLGW
jgi:CRISPR system Cascade subunit CasD